MQISLLLISCFVGLALVGCSDDPVFTSGQVGISLGLKEGAIVGDQIDSRKNVSTESGNPYGAFIQEVKDEFGDSPREIRIEAVSLQIQDTKDDVAVFQDLWPESVEVFLAADDTVSGFTVASVQGPTGLGPINVPTRPVDDATALETLLASGNFRVGVRGKTALTTASKFDTKVAVTLSFGVYER